MNNKRRERLLQASGLLEKAASMIEQVKDEEQDSFDNLPENLQCSDRGEAMEEAVSELGEAIDLIGEAAEHVSCAQNGR